MRQDREGDAVSVVEAQTLQRRARGGTTPIADSTLQRVRIQNRLIQRDIIPRIGAVTTAFVLASSYLDAAPLLALFGGFLLTEIGYFGARGASDRGSRSARTLLLVAAFCCAVILAALSLMLADVPNAVAKIVAVTILTTSLMHCIIIRSAWSAFGVVTAVPFLFGLATVVLKLVPIADMPLRELAIGATALIIAALYVGKSLWEISTTRRRLMEANEAVRRASDERDRFFTGVSHELRTPLNAICGMAELLAEDPTPALSHERTHLLLRAARSLNAIVDDILDQARLASGKHVLNLREADPGAELRSAIEIFRPQAVSKGLEFQVDLARDLPERAVFDPQKTRQVMSNLIANAIRYTEQGSVVVRLRIEQDPEGFVLAVEVSDTGRGIDLETRRSLFTEYERGSADAISAGTGLGLSISRRFARMMGGDVDVVSEPGRGTTFRFTARMGAADEATETAFQRGEQGATTSTKTASVIPGAPRPKVLVVDDSAANRYVARSYLKDFAERVDEAANGREALDLLARTAYDVMLIDLHMPVLDGPSTLRVLRARRVGTIPVIVLTASNEPDCSAVLEKLDVHSTLSKPVRKATLIGAICSAISAPPAEVGSVSQRKLRSPCDRGPSDKPQSSDCHSAPGSLRAP